MGVRLISLTWNFSNCFGAPNSKDPAVMSQGLTNFGKKAVVRMNELGMLVDVPQMQILFHLLHKESISDDQIEKIAWKHTLRVIQESMK